MKLDVTAMMTLATEPPRRRGPPTAAALTVPSATIRCPDPGATVSFAQDACRPSTQCVATRGRRRVTDRGGVGWGAHTVRCVPKAFWSVHSAPQPLPSRPRTARAGGFKC